MIHGAVVPKLVGGIVAVVVDAALVAQVASGQAQPLLGTWGQAGVFIAGCGAGAAAVAWTLRQLREVRASTGNGNGGEVAAERRTANAVRQVVEEVADTRHELRQQIHALELGMARLEKELAQEFRAIERRLGGHP